MENQEVIKQESKLKDIVISMLHSIIEELEDGQDLDSDKIDLMITGAIMELNQPHDENKTCSFCGK